MSWRLQEKRKGANAQIPKRARTQLTYRFVRLTLASYEKLEARVEQRLGELAQAGVRRVVLLGSGEVARLAAEERVLDAARLEDVVE